MNKTNIVIGTGMVLIVSVLSVNIIHNTNEYNQLVDRYNILISENNQVNNKYHDTVSSYNELVRKYNNLENKYSASVNSKTKYVTNESCILYNIMHELYYERPPEGLYMKNTDFYCVWVKDREQSHIQEVEEHENAHYQVNKNYNHFCVEAEKEQHIQSCEVLQ